MYRSILVPLDGTILAERALPFATALADFLDAELHLVHVSGQQRRNGGAASQQLYRLADMLSAGGVVASCALPSGDIVQAILREAASCAADLIVIATNYASVLGHRYGSSTAEALLASTDIPVMIVRDWHTERAARQFGRGAHILVPLDGSRLAEAALTAAKELVATQHGDLILLRVVPPEPAWTPQRGARTASGDQGAERAYLQALQARLAVEGVTARGVLATGDVVQAINDTAQRYDVALVALATHGQTGYPQLALGSVARRVIWGGTVPTVIVRPLPIGVMADAGVVQSDALAEVQAGA